MRITDHIDLFYPSAEKRRAAAERRREVGERCRSFVQDLQLENIAKLVSPVSSQRFIALAGELSDDVEVLNYRLDCLEDFLNNPDLAYSFRKIIRDMSGKDMRVEENAEVRINSFMDIKNKMDDLDFFLHCIDEINGIYKRIGRNIKSEGVSRLFKFFSELPETEDIKEIAENLSQLKETFSKTIRSVRIGVNFDSSMTPESAGLLEISYDKIYPQGNILEKLVFKNLAGKEQFSGEEHLNSVVKKTPVDIDTALFRELSKYTREYAQRISYALKSYRSSFFTDISELEEQLDYYDGAASFVQSVRARGMKLCRPVFLPAEDRALKLKGAYDLTFYRQLASHDPSARLEDKIVVNDIDMSDSARFYMITGANNGGKTTFARAVGVCQAMAQAGLYVPCESAEISLCDGIYTHFPRDEQVGIDTSRFTTEIKDLKEIICQLTDKSMVILNESLQSTTPEECLKIAEIHLEIMAAAGVKGIYVTHLTGLYKKIGELNEGGYKTRFESLVSTADSTDGKRSYKLEIMPPPKESLAFTIYKQFGATLGDLKK